MGVRRPNKKVGLALGSGAAWGLAHVGAVAVLQQEGIPVDMIAGTSAGAMIGALIAQGKSAEELKQLLLKMTWRRLVRLVDLSPFSTGFVRGNRIRGLLEVFIGGDVDFSDLKLPLACVATDVDTGEEVVIDQGSVLDAVRASISMPGIFTVVRRDGRRLIDGGLVDPVPVSVAERMGAGFVIAVNVMPELAAYNLQRSQKPSASRRLNLVTVVVQSLYISSHALAAMSLKAADVAIMPQVGHIGGMDFHRAHELVEEGEKAARLAVPEIKRKLGL